MGFFDGLFNLGSTALSSGLNMWNTDLENSYNQRRAREENSFQMGENERAFQREIDMWNMQNEYNSPKSQMERYQSAGLSPYLVYGQGTPGNATNYPDYEPIDYETYPHSGYKPISPPVFQNLLQEYQVMTDIENVQENTRATAIQNDINQASKQAQILSKLYDGMYKEGMLTAQDYDNKMKEIAYNVESALQDDKIKLGENQTALSDIQIKKNMKEFELLSTQVDRKQLENFLYSIGLEGDNPISMFMRFISLGLITDFSALRKLFEKGMPYAEKAYNKTDEFIKLHGQPSGLNNLH